MTGDKKIVNLGALEELATELKTKLENLNVPVSGSVYKPAGNLSSPDFSKLIEENLGKVYNITQEFTTDSEHFVETGEKKYSAGTDIAVVEVDSGTYKFNVLSGFVDLSEYPNKPAVQSMIDSTLDAEIVSSDDVEQMLQRVFGDE